MVQISFHCLIVLFQNKGSDIQLVGVGHCFAWQGTRPLFTDERYTS